MTRAKVTSKGQVTIPAAIRRQLDLKPGDYLEFHVVQETEATVRPFRVKSISELYGLLPATRPYPLLVRALGQMAARNAPFVDAIVVELARAGGKAVCSFDRDFDRLNVERVSPSTLL